MMEFILLRRIYEPEQVLGILNVVEGARILFQCKTLELGWRNNLPNISCVPAGHYQLSWEHSPSFNRKLWELKNVPNRSEIKFHVANYSKELRGCIAVGDHHLDMNGDGKRDLRNSAHTLQRLHEVTTGLTEASLWIYGLGDDNSL